MSDSLLKREFNQKTVRRMRNLITGKTANSTSILTGYGRSMEDHPDGVPFEEGGKQWVYINGLKQNVTKLDAIKKLSLMPLSCPSCKNQLKTIYDKKMYIIHKLCMDCVAKFETKLKLEGKYDDYKKSMITDNKEHFVKEYEDFLNDALRSINVKNHVTEDGDIETWTGNNRNIIEQTQKHLKDIKDLQ